MPVQVEAAQNEGQLLNVAMMLLARSVADLTPIISRNASETALLAENAKNQLLENTKNQLRTTERSQFSGNWNAAARAQAQLWNIPDVVDPTATGPATAQPEPRSGPATAQPEALPRSGGWNAGSGKRTPILSDDFAITDSNPAAAAADKARAEKEARQEARAQEMAESGVQAGTATIPVFIVGPQSLLDGLSRALTNRTEGTTPRTPAANRFADNFTARGGNDQGAILKGITAPLAGLVAQFGALVGPMAILAAVVSSSASGFQVLGTAVKLLGATLAPLILPVVAVVAAGLTMLSNELWEDIEPALDDWYEIVMEELVPAVKAMVEIFRDMARYAMHPGQLLEDFGDDLRDGLRSLNPFTSKEDDEEKSRNRDEERRAERGQTPPGPKEAERRTGREKNPDERFDLAMGDVLGELRHSMGSKASIGSITNVGNQAQLAALNESPLERKILERVTKAVEHLGKIANRRKEARAAYGGGDTGAGDFSGDPGVGGGGDYGGGE